MRILLFAEALDALDLGVLLLAHHGLEHHCHHIAHDGHEEAEPTGTAHSEENKEDQDDGFHDDGLCTSGIKC